ncbi:hypothetical protein [Microbacterium halotolerans]|uniref:hypothetical protein n=1 Tax=Microbacterium halotolerans TaxID=246613 RepID=UPI0013C370DB|nr:hypothetical protein [Microbacterium halotolerans]
MPNRSSHVIDLRPLTHRPAFARLWVGNLLGGLGGLAPMIVAGPAAACCRCSSGSGLCRR